MLKAAAPPTQPPAIALDWHAQPLDLLRRWPAHAPLACLTSGGTLGPRSRWSIFASPSLTITIADDAEHARDPLACFAQLPIDRSPTDLPFLGGWIGWLSFDLGRRLEPTARARPSEPAAAAWHDWPLIELFECPAAYLHDRKAGTWWAVGDVATLPEIDWTAAPPAPRANLTTPTSHTGRERFMIAVERARELVRDGHVFQANIAHHLRAELHAEPRHFAARLLEAAGAWYGGYLESRDATGAIRHAIATASPELFLEFDPRTRRVVTRPIKGTRSATDERARRELKSSEKDLAELNMIVDLMRNDLGRVCAFGSVAVDDPRAIERHGERNSPQHSQGASSTSESSGDHLPDHNSAAMNPVPSVGNAGVFHGVATVSGVLRNGLSLADLLCATFPPGSVTGAPKVRAMQIIDTLEPLRRGPYCGAIGYISRCARSGWNVAIRTAMLTPNRARGPHAFDVSYPVGAGIVEGSEPLSEWNETLDKAGVLRGAS